MAPRLDKPAVTSGPLGHEPVKTRTGQTWTESENVALIAAVYSPGRDPQRKPTRERREFPDSFGQRFGPQVERVHDIRRLGVVGVGQREVRQVRSGGTDDDQRTRMTPTQLSEHRKEPAPPVDPVEAREQRRR